MAIWAELHCDIPSVTRSTFRDPDYSYEVLVCYSDMNKHPSGFVTSVSQLYPIARQEGWRKLDDFGWVCPGCQKHL